MECYQLLLPEPGAKKKNDVPSARKLIKLMKNLKKKVGYQIDESFTDFLKSNI